MLPSYFFLNYLKLSTKIKRKIKSELENIKFFIQIFK